jgi:amino acid permease
MVGRELGVWVGIHLTLIFGQCTLLGHDGVLERGLGPEGIVT